MSKGRHEAEAEILILDRIGRLRTLSFAQAAELPEAADEDAVVAGRTCALTTFMQRLDPDRVLVTVQVARRSFLGFGSRHMEVGLVFSRDGSIRNATLDELVATGG